MEMSDCQEVETCLVEKDTEISITKLESAQRQLETAIALYFNDGDPVSIHTLCCAAYDVIHALNKKRNSPLELNDLMLKDLDQFLTTRADKKLFHNALSEAKNFFKHASSDPDATQKLDTRYTEGLMADAVQTYAKLVGECPKEMALYFWWFVSLNPEFIDQVAAQISMPDSQREMLLNSLKAMPKDRLRFYKEFWPHVTPFSI